VCPKKLDEDSSQNSGGRTSADGKVVHCENDRVTLDPNSPRANLLNKNCCGEKLDDEHTSASKTFEEFWTDAWDQKNEDGSGVIESMVGAKQYQLFNMKLEAAVKVEVGVNDRRKRSSCADVPFKAVTVGFFNTSDLDDVKEEYSVVKSMVIVGDIPYARASNQKVLYFEDAKSGAALKPLELVSSDDNATSSEIVSVSFRFASSERNLTNCDTTIGVLSCSASTDPLLTKVSPCEWKLTGSVKVLNGPAYTLKFTPVADVFETFTIVVTVMPQAALPISPFWDSMLVFGVVRAPPIFFAAPKVASFVAHPIFASHTFSSFSVCAGG